MKRTITTIVLAVALCAAAPAIASADTRCALGTASSITTNQVGMSVRFSRLIARDGMNCPSARYVLNHWIRAKWAQTYRNFALTDFYDGYVTWHCRRVTGSPIRWRCKEYTSFTMFTFRAALTGGYDD